MPKLPKYVQRRYNTYYAALNIPEDLRHNYPGKAPGKQLFKLIQSLETDSLAVARRRVAPVIASWQAEFARLRNEPQDDATYFRRRLQRTQDEAERRRILAQIEMEADNLASPTYSDDPSQHAGEEQAAFEEAKDFWDRATGKVTGTTDHLDDWIKRWEVKPKTRDMGQSFIKQFAEAFPTIPDVTHEAVQRWIDSLNIGGSTIQRNLSALRSYWKYLQRPDVKAVPRDFQPFSDLELPKKPDGRKGTRKAFTQEQMVQIMEAAQEQGHGRLDQLIVIAAYTGCRIEELCSLKVEQVHAKAPIPYLEIQDAKTAAGWRQVPLHSSITVFVNALAKDSTDGYLLSGLTPDKYGNRSSAIGKRFGYLKGRLGYGPDYVFHSIRKTVATLLENAGVSENVAADILGHEKPRITYGLYSGGSSLKVKAEAIGKISYAE